MITCYIVDDESHAIETLTAYVEKVPGLVLIGSATNPLVALEEITKSVHPDITFLDVDMPQLSGIELAGLINDRTKVIFTTAFSDYAVAAFEKNASDYMLKPVSFERFLSSIKKVTDNLPASKANAADDHFYIKSNIKGKVIKLAFNDIVHVESIKNYLSIYTGDNKYVTYLTMKELEKVLPENLFLRVHKSFIVNKNYIKAIDGASIQLSNNTKIPVGQTYKDILQNYISEKLIASSR
ncbi:LytR/AlgR family response regulator transcription factor [Daejeonella lutea]|uniref:Two component transcriptional regulator, LytTR family n=1 Tax=Daejeonella lutea TaxID=572036 RepID=A0A1T5B286_9SPHI|nr:LytTR family DNA-binding domain-containing protein [Daejeonella lutea]SKB41295.1 two component transcriptional regulator, LytTR family [Daejeonella lutea]